MTTSIGLFRHPTNAEKLRAALTNVGIAATAVPHGDYHVVKATLHDPSSMELGNRPIEAALRARN